MSMSNSTANDTLKALLAGTDPAYRSATGAWLALYTSDPGATGTATPLCQTSCRLTNKRGCSILERYR